MRRSDVEFADRIRSTHHILLDLKKTFVRVVCPPPDQLDKPVNDFNAGDAGGVDAAARIEIGQLPLSGILEPVGMPTNQHGFMAFDPFVEIFFDFVPFVGIFDRAGGILDTERM